MSRVECSIRSQDYENTNLLCATVIFRPVHPRKHLSRPYRPYILPTATNSKLHSVPIIRHPEMRPHTAGPSIKASAELSTRFVSSVRYVWVTEAKSTNNAWGRSVDGRICPLCQSFWGVCHVEDADSLAAALYLDKRDSEPWKSLDGCEYATYDGALSLCAQTLDKACVLSQAQA